MLKSLTAWTLMASACACLAGEVSIFNGKDLSGWDGDPRLWKVVDGVLTGETDGAEKKIDANSFLIWKDGEPGDFVLKFKARITGSNNSGVQYRSKRHEGDGWVVGGYQMDLHPKHEYLAMLYEERGRGIACERGQKVKLVEGKKPEVIESFETDPVDLAQWNEYRLEATGNVVKHFVNGKLAAEIHDEDAAKRAAKGVLALQLHAGPAMKAEFKDIVLEEK
ncbi:MAG: DUF1080 domain-containing protein [Akkermansiaceae bacterium]|nr:DUF1080 domain-containing protein [Akkermansiaceae bacterium]